ncbi:MAG: molybdenum cofactor guanylyltransferase [Candidatus Dormibacteraceae bacterium]
MSIDATLLVLAGGQSRRMGRPKAWLKVGNTTLLGYVIERLAPAFAEVLVSFAGPEQVEHRLPYAVVFDRLQSAGPLAGLEAGLSSAQHDVLFAIACDMPYVTRSTAERAIAMAEACDAVIPRHDGRQEPVCAAYRKSSLPVITAAIDSGRFTMSKMTERLRVLWLEGIDPQEFISLNMPEDVELFAHALGG